MPVLMKSHIARDVVIHKSKTNFNAKVARP